MPTNILMPALSPTMEKGNLARWLKKEGEKIKSGDVIAEIETDKAPMENEAVDEGTLAKIVVPEGTQDVAVNSVIAVLAGEGEDVKAAAKTAKAAPAKAPEKKAESTSPTVKPPAQRQETPRETAKSSISPASEKGAPKAAADTQFVAPGNRVFSSPLARRLAKESGIEIGRVQGSGPHGRIIARDIDAARSGKGLRLAGPTPGAAVAPAMSDQQILSLYEPGSFEIVPHDGMRRTIAQRLTA